jgi:hypothetical protein
MNALTAHPIPTAQKNVGWGQATNRRLSFDFHTILFFH